MKLNTFAALALATVAGVPASAAILVNDGPAGNTTFNFVNQASGQNFLMRFTLAHAATVDGMEIFTNPAFVSFDEQLTIKIRNDAGGLPAATNLFTTTTPVSQIQSEPGQPGFVVRVFGSFAPVLLQAGTYWIGMSGAVNELGIYAFDSQPNGAADQHQLNGDALNITPQVGNLAFRVHGNRIAVPEPATWALMILGFGAVGAASRRRTVRVTYA
jgi:hypothetical protein